MTRYADKPWFRSYPKETSLTITPPHDDMLSAWRTTVSARGAQPCVHYFDDTWSFTDIDAMSDALAAWLETQGVGTQDRVAIYLQNDPQWLVALLATWKVGGIAVAVNPMMKARELLSQLQDSQACVLVCLQDLRSSLDVQALSETGVRVVVSTHPADFAPDRGIPAVMNAYIADRVGQEAWDMAEILREHQGQTPAPVRSQPSDPAMLTYTSGTTGPSKGAINTHGNLTHNAQVFTESFQLSSDDVILGVAPLFHVTGSVGYMAVTILTGTPLVLYHRFDVTETLRLMQRWRTTFTIGSLTVFIAMMNDASFAEHDWSTMTRIGSGGAPVSLAVLERFEEATGIYIQSVYGLTETTSPSHITPMGTRAPVDPNTGAVSVGLPVPGADVTVVDPTTRQDVPVGDEGEIVIAGPMVVPGYWHKPEETAHAIPEGRLHTGDIGFMNNEGWFFIIDRKKDQINAGGYKVWPREVEDVLYEHDAVREAAVVGVSDPYRGETVKAFVSLRAGMTVDPEDLIAHCKADLAAYKYPRIVEILDELPKNAAGKLLRRELRDQDGMA